MDNNVYFGPGVDDPTSLPDEPHSAPVGGGLTHWYVPPVGTTMKEEITVGKIETPNGTMYRTSDRVEGDGVVLAGPKHLIPLETARDWARRGWLNDPALLDGEPLHDPREENKLDEPREELKEDRPEKDTDEDPNAAQAPSQAPQGAEPESPEKPKRKRNRSKKAKKAE